MKTIPLVIAATLALSACSQTDGERPYGNDMLPSAESAAFQRLDARLGYADARIEYDAGNCALYRATGPDGRVYRERLRNEDNTAICAP